jgi:hypothetical protein
VRCAPTLRRVSIPVALADLPVTTASYRWAYLLTVRDDLRPHVVAVTPQWSDEALTMAVGAGTAANAAARSAITLCYPPVADGGHSLVVDGTAEPAGDGTLRFWPTSAVLHRPAPPA